MEPEQKTNGALVGAVIIIIILIIGGIYFWKSSMKEMQTPVQQETTENTDTEASIEAELDSMEFESLDEGVN